MSNLQLAHALGTAIGVALSAWIWTSVRRRSQRWTRKKIGSSEVPQGDSSGAEEHAEVRVVRDSIKFGKHLGAKTAREAAEMVAGREITDDEWRQHRDPWEKAWDADRN